MIVRRKRKLLILASWLFVGAGALVLVASLYFSWQQEEIIVHQPKTITTTEEAMPSTEKPRPSEFESYTVAADLPRYLFIEKLGIRAMVRPMDVDASNRIEAPRSAYDVGWYNGSAKPGQAGAMLIDGHVSAGRTPGVFYDLKNLAPNDSITLERGDGVSLTYRVVRSQVYDIEHVDMATVLTAVTAGRPGINLITCTGDVIRGTNNYNQRLVVFAEQQ